MKIRRIKAVFMKQMLNLSHNISVLTQLFIFPLLILVTESLTKVGYSVKMVLIVTLSSMFIGLIPMTIVSNIIREDRFTGTFRMMIMSTVKPFEYFIGVNAWVLFVSIVDAFIFGISAGFSDTRLVIFIICFIFGIITTLMLGSLISIAIRGFGQISTGIINVIVITNSVFPIFASLNKTILNITQFSYQQQVYNVIGDLFNNKYGDLWYSFTIIGANFLVFSIFFLILYKKNKLIQ
jgi:ABC-2 type transport system permease protein